ncbi:MAG TPA: MmcQ/YjbR family DNA-binding protein [Microlunatus sp.]
MVTFDDVARIALALPESEETTSYGNVSWAVKSGGKTKGKGFVWERPLSKKDRKLLAEAGEIDVPPDEVILAARVEDLAEKEAVLAEHTEATFTTPHFDGYPAVLIRLDRVDDALLTELVTSAWLAVAPPSLREELDPGATGGDS